MEHAATKTLRIGEWRVDPKYGQISRNGKSVRVEARTMRLLLCLASHPGEVVSTDDLLNQVWSGVIVTPDSVYQAVASLRRLLGDDPRQPTYIATVPRLGYRMVASVTPWDDGALQNRPADDRTAIEDPTVGDYGLENRASEGTFNAGGLPKKLPLNLRVRFILVAAAAVCFVLLASFALRSRIANSEFLKPSNSAAQPQRSVAVLPFLDLTEGMRDEEFADGITEELIDRLSKVQGLHVPGATSSFYFKGKQVPIPEIAKTLGVSYLLDGSVRKSGATVRVAARLVRGDNGYVVWSETYDRPLRDILMVQDDIAGEVTKALKTSIEAN